MLFTGGTHQWSGEIKSVSINHSLVTKEHSHTVMYLEFIIDQLWNVLLRKNKKKYKELY